MVGARERSPGWGEAAPPWPRVATAGAHPVGNDPAPRPPTPHPEGSATPWESDSLARWGKLGGRRGEAQLWAAAGNLKVKFEFFLFFWFFFCQGLRRLSAAEKPSREPSFQFSRRPLRRWILLRSKKATKDLRET